MIRLGIVVEGPTEVEFVKRVLAKSLFRHTIAAIPVSMDGNVKIRCLAREMANLFWNFDYVSSFVDFYGFRDKESMSVDELEGAVGEAVKEQIGIAFDESRIFVYVQRHEFEGILFSDVDGFRGVGLNISQIHIRQLQRIRQQFSTPEDINDESHTAPSKRLGGILPNFRKRLHGPLVAETIGIPKISAECPRFSGWLRRLERLPQTQRG